MKGKRPLRRALRRAQKIASFTGQPHRVVRDNGNEAYRITAHIPRGNHYGILVRRNRRTDASEKRRKAVAMFVEHYRAASTPAKMYGLDWYARAYRTGVPLGGAVRIPYACGRSDPRGDVPTGHVEARGKLTEDALRGKRVRHYKQVQRKVRDLLKGAEPENVLRGPKIRAFYRAIMGHKNAVVLDTWMLRAAIGARTCSANSTEILRETSR